MTSAHPNHPPQPCHPHPSSRALAQALSSPLAGFLALYYDRAAVVGAGTVFWAVSTAAVGLSQSYWQCAIWRAINGVGLAIVVPAVQSFIADR